MSDSMNGGKLYDVKAAMSFLLDKKKRLLTKKDRLAIITLLSGGALLPMNEENMKDLLNKVDAIRTKPWTNIWGALSKALEVLLQRQGDINCVIIYFTLSK